MQPRFRDSSILFGLCVVPSLSTVNPAFAQTFTTLHGFTGCADGGSPSSKLLLSGGTLYGTASGGGTGRCGTVFAVNTNGTGFTNLYSFPPLGGSSTNIGGSQPLGGL